MSLTRRQRVRRAMLGVLLVTVTVHLAGGWYFANRIYTDALDASAPWEWERNVLINDSFVPDNGKGSVTVIDSGAENAGLRSSGTYGLWYDGGFGVMTGEPVIIGPRVTRDFTISTGKPPAIGASAAVNSFAYPRGPLPPMREVTYDSDLGEMTGVYQPGEGSVWAILVHGRGSGPDEQFRMMRATTALGMPSLAIRYRNDTGVPKDPSGEHGFGTTEWHDVQAAVDYAVDNGATGIVLAGGSMGGAIAAAYLRNAEDTKSENVGLVRAVVLDSPLLDFSATVSHGAKQIQLAGGPSVPASLTWMAKQLAGLRFGVDWDTVDYNDDTDWVRVPTLIFHGDADLTVPIDTSRELASRDDDVTLVEADGVGHLESWNVDPAAYETRVSDFLTPLVS
ncbi:MAG: alpha/beta hydrolase [Nocardioides sp.]